jgi:hypothetical protein
MSTANPNIGDKILSVTRGRSTAFFLLFFISGNVMAYFGKLNGDYITFVGVLGGLILGHSGQENYFATKSGAKIAPDNPAALSKDTTTTLDSPKSPVGGG